MADELAECVQSFYYRKDISGLMHEKKDCIAVVKDNDKVKVQKRLAVGNLKEIFKKTYMFFTLYSSALLDWLIYCILVLSCLKLIVTIFILYLLKPLASKVLHPSLVVHPPFKYHELF